MFPTRISTYPECGFSVSPLRWMALSLAPPSRPLNLRDSWRTLIVIVRAPSSKTEVACPSSTDGRNIALPWIEYGKQLVTSKNSFLPSHGTWCNLFSNFPTLFASPEKTLRASVLFCCRILFSVKSHATWMRTFSSVIHSLPPCS